MRISSIFLYSRYLQKGKQSGPEGNILLYELAERALDSQVTASIKEHISQVSLEIKFIMVLYVFMVRYTFVALSEICLSVHSSSPQGYICFWMNYSSQLVQVSN